MLEALPAGVRRKLLDGAKPEGAFGSIVSSCDLENAYADIGVKNFDSCPRINREGKIYDYAVVLERYGSAKLVRKIAHRVQIKRARAK